MLCGRVESDALRQIADGILERFVSEGLTKRERDLPSAKIQMPLVRLQNKQKIISGILRTWYRKGNPFDATTIIEKYANSVVFDARENQ